VILDTRKQNGRPRERERARLIKSALFASQPMEKVDYSTHGAGLSS
jgi:hypothetical protein